MKIIKPGKAPCEDIFKGECGSCGCELEASRSEVTYYKHNRENFGYTYKCPTRNCNSNIFMYKKELLINHDNNSVTQDH